MMMRVDRQPRCRCRVGPGRFEVRARIERFAEPTVLLLLAEGRSHGYQLADHLEELLDEGRVDFGNLYRLLRALEEEGLVASTWRQTFRSLTLDMTRQLVLKELARARLGPRVLLRS